MKKIKLTQGKYALVDDRDFDYLNQWKWYARDGYSGFYAVRRVQKKQGEIDEKSSHIRMHNLILKPKEGLEVDHINHNTHRTGLPAEILGRARCGVSRHPSLFWFLKTT